MHKAKDNPFKIPDLTPMYEAVRDYVKKHQGEKGFILTDNPDCDTIWTIVFDDYDYDAKEYEVKAIRVNEYNSLQIIYDPSSVKYDESSVCDMMEDNEVWYDVQYDDYVYFIPTIFNIAESIQEYVETQNNAKNTQESI